MGPADGEPTDPGNGAGLDPGAPAGGSARSLESEVGRLKLMVAALEAMVADLRERVARSEPLLREAEARARSAERTIVEPKRVRGALDADASRARSDVDDRADSLAEFARELERKESALQRKETELREREIRIRSSEKGLPPPAVRRSYDRGRQPTGVPSLDRLLYGGLENCSLTLLTAPAGIGAELILRGLAARAVRHAVGVVWISGALSKSELREAVEAQLPNLEMYEEGGWGPRLFGPEEAAVLGPTDPLESSFSHFTAKNAARYAIILSEVSRSKERAEIEGFYQRLRWVAEFTRSQEAAALVWIDPDRDLGLEEGLVRSLADRVLTLRKAGEGSELKIDRLTCDGDSWRVWDPDPPDTAPDGNQDRG
jgi:hypothetical protein